jgi:hypothetical protein
MLPAMLNRATMRVADTTEVSGRVTADSRGKQTMKPTIRTWLALVTVSLGLYLGLSVCGLAQNDQGQNDQDALSVRRVRLQASSTTAFPGDTFVIAAVGTERVGGAGTDLTAIAEGNFCDIHFDRVAIDDDGHTAVLVGKVVDAAHPQNLGAFVKITAHTDGRVNFVFQNLPPFTNLGTGAGGIDFFGATVSIVNIF